MTANAEPLLTFAETSEWEAWLRVQDAKKPETRARRIEQFVAPCAAGTPLHPKR